MKRFQASSKKGTTNRGRPSLRFFAFVVTLHQIISFRAFQQKNFPYCKRQCNINVRVTTTPPKPSRKFSMNKSCHVKKQCKTPTLNDCRNCIAKLISNVNEMMVMGSRIVIIQTGEIPDIVCLLIGISVSSEETFSLIFQPPCV